MNAPPRMAYVLMGELFFIEEIRLLGMLPTTKPYQDLLRSRIMKREEVYMEFYGTSAIIDKNWKKANQDQDRWSPDWQCMDFIINCVKIKNSTIQLRIVSVSYTKKMWTISYSELWKQEKTITEYSKKWASKDKQFKCTFVRTYTFIIIVHIIIYLISNWNVDKNPFIIVRFIFSSIKWIKYLQTAILCQLYFRQSRSVEILRSYDRSVLRKHINFMVCRFLQLARPS